MAGLTWGQFNRRDRYKSNWRVVYERMKNNLPFTLVQKSTTDSEDGIHVYFSKVAISIPAKVNGRYKKDNIFLDLEPKRFSTFENFYREVKKIIPDSMVSEGAGVPITLIFLPSRNSPIRNGTNTNQILKDLDFGGRPLNGQVRNIFWGNLKYYVDNVDSTYKLNYPTATEAGEADFINTFNQELDAILKKTGLSSIDLMVGNTTFENIVGVNKVEGTVKADLALVALEKGKLNDVGWFSHKQGNVASDFQQWGGVTHYASDKLGADETLDKFPEIRAFAKYMAFWCGNGMQYDLKSSNGVGFTAVAEIEDNDLKMESVYGKNFGSSKYGVSNCNGVLQGSPSIKKVGNKYKLEMSSHIVMNPTAMTGGYEPVLMLINKGDRSQYGIPGARIAVQPRASRKAKFIVSKDRNGNYQMNPA